MPVPWWVLALIVFGAPLVFAAALCFQAWRAFREEDRQAGEDALGEVLRFKLTAEHRERPPSPLAAQRSNPMRPGRAERRGL